MASKPAIYYNGGKWRVKPANTAGHPHHRKKIMRRRNRMAYFWCWLWNSAQGVV